MLISSNNKARTVLTIMDTACCFDSLLRTLIILDISELAENQQFIT